MVDIPENSFLKSNFNEKIEASPGNFLDEEMDQMDPLTYSGSETTATINEEQFFDASDQPMPGSLTENAPAEPLSNGIAESQPNKIGKSMNLIDFDSELTINTPEVSQDGQKFEITENGTKSISKVTPSDLKNDNHIIEKSTESIQCNGSEHEMDDSNGSSSTPNNETKTMNNLDEAPKSNDDLQFGDASERNENTIDLDKIFDSLLDPMKDEAVSKDVNDMLVASETKEISTEPEKETSNDEICPEVVTVVCADKVNEVHDETKSCANIDLTSNPDEINEEIILQPKLSSESNQKVESSEEVNDRIENSNIEGESSMEINDKIEDTKIEIESPKEVPEKIENPNIEAGPSKEINDKMEDSKIEAEPINEINDKIEDSNSEVEPAKKINDEMEDSNIGAELMNDEIENSNIEVEPSEAINDKTEDLNIEVEPMKEIDDKIESSNIEVGPNAINDKIKDSNIEVEPSNKVNDEMEDSNIETISSNKDDEIMIIDDDEIFDLEKQKETELDLFDQLKENFECSKSTDEPTEKTNEEKSITIEAETIENKETEVVASVSLLSDENDPIDIQESKENNLLEAMLDSPRSVLQSNENSVSSSRDDGDSNMNEFGTGSSDDKEENPTNEQVDSENKTANLDEESSNFDIEMSNNVNDVSMDSSTKKSTPEPNEDEQMEIVNEEKTDIRPESEKSDVAIELDDDDDVVITSESNDSPKTDQPLLAQLLQKRITEEHSSNSSKENLNDDEVDEQPVKRSAKDIPKADQPPAKRLRIEFVGHEKEKEKEKEREEEKENENIETERSVSKSTTENQISKDKGDDIVLIESNEIKGIERLSTTPTKELDEAVESIKKLKAANELEFRAIEKNKPREEPLEPSKVADSKIEIESGIEEENEHLKIQSNPKPEAVDKRSIPLEFMKKFKTDFVHMSRKDLEEFVLTKIVEAIVHKSEYSQLKEKVEGQEQIIQTFRTKVQELNKQYRDLEMVYARLKKDLENKNQSIVTPIKITRAVGLQVCLQKNSDRSGSAVSVVQKRTVQRASLPPPSTPPIRVIASNQPKQIFIQKNPSPQTQRQIALKQQQALKQAQEQQQQQQRVLIAAKAAQKRSAATQSTIQLVQTQQRKILPIQSVGRGSLAFVTSVDQRNTSPLIVKKIANSNNRVVVVSQSVATTPTTTIQKTIVNASTPNQRAGGPSGFIQVRQNLMANTSGNTIDLTDEDDAPKTRNMVNNPPALVALNSTRNRSTATATIVQTQPTGARPQVVTPQPAPRSASAPNVRKYPVILPKGNVVPPPVQSTSAQNQTALTAQRGKTQTRHRHPAPLPYPYNPPGDPNWKKVPPRPIIRINNNSTGIVISWNMEQTKDHAEVVSYQIYAYQETNSPPSTDTWRHVGDVKAMLLPMAVTLTQFQEGQKYHFAVRAVDEHARTGLFSVPRTY